MGKPIADFRDRVLVPMFDITFYQPPYFHWALHQLPFTTVIRSCQNLRQIIGKIEIAKMKVATETLVLMTAPKSCALK